MFLRVYRSLLDDLFPQRSVQASRKFPCRFESTRRNFFDGTVAGIVLDRRCGYFRQSPVLFLQELHGWRRIQESEPVSVDASTVWPDHRHARCDRVGYRAGDVARQSFANAVDTDCPEDVHRYAPARKRMGQIVSSSSAGGLTSTSSSRQFIHCQKTFRLNGGSRPGSDRSSAMTAANSNRSKVVITLSGRFYRY